MNSTLIALCLCTVALVQRTNGADSSFSVAQTGCCGDRLHSSTFLLFALPHATRPAQLLYTTTCFAARHAPHRSVQVGMLRRHETTCAQLFMTAQPRAEVEMYRRRKEVLLNVRIQIMEDVVRRVNDPALKYHRKRETVEELEGYLHRMRSLTADPDVIFHPAGVAPRLERPGQSSARSTQQQQQQRDKEIESILQSMRDASVVAVLRGKNEDRLVARGLELAQCGCRCIEVTLDSNGALEVLRRLREQLPSSVLLGAATVMDARQASDAISAGAKFITSPIAAVELMRVCQEAGECPFQGSIKALIRLY